MLKCFAYLHYPVRNNVELDMANEQQFYGFASLYSYSYVEKNILYNLLASCVCKKIIKYCWAYIS